MQGEVAVVREQGQTFAVLAVKPHIVQSPNRAPADGRCGP